MPQVIFTHADTDDGENITVYYDGALYPAPSSHPAFSQIKDACIRSMKGHDVSGDEIVSLFDAEKTVKAQVERLSERVSVKDGQITLDGDPAEGVLQDHILSLLDAGEDVSSLVNFYEKLTTNPLGNVQAGLYTWMKSQASGGTFTITPDGDLLGYKSVREQAPEWREFWSTVYVPSRRGSGVVNDEDVPADKFIEQLPGDVVEMPRSKVLDKPSAACGDGLHIGTYQYASTFYGGDTVMLVRFSPRDVVSLPSSNNTWKLRVCRYTVVGPVDEALDTPLFDVDAAPEPEDWVEVDEDESLVGRVVYDDDGDKGKIVAFDGDEVNVEYEDGDWPNIWWDVEDLTFESPEKDEGTDLALDAPISEGDRIVDAEGDEGTVTSVEGDNATVTYDRPDALGGEWRVGYSTMAIDKDPDAELGLDDSASFIKRTHGKGGPTSQRAKGTGRNPAQDEKGRFSAGRPGSRRDSGTGQFC